MSNDIETWRENNKNKTHLDKCIEFIHQMTGLLNLTLITVTALQGEKDELKRENQKLMEELDAKKILKNQAIVWTCIRGCGTIVSYDSTSCNRCYGDD